MLSQDIKPLFAGSDDEDLLFVLHRRMHKPRTDAQRTFRDAWDAFELVHSDGFEILLEQSTPLEDYSAAFGKIGMPHVQPIFFRVLALIPPDLRQPQNEKALYEYVRTRFDELKALAYEFYDACVAFVPKASCYVREHRDDFYEFVGSSRVEAEPGAEQ